MVILTRPNSESRLASFICDTKTHCSTEHHHRALRIVVHDVLKIWQESLIVDHVEVNCLICHNLNSLVSSNEVDLTSHVVQGIVFLPEASLLIDSEEKDRARWSRDESCVKEEIHGTKIGFYDALPAALHCLGVDSDAIALSVEGGALSGLFAVE